jgi:CBS domain-containing protein
MARTSEADESVEECMRLMTENRVRHPSVMQNREILGIISIGDLVNWIISAQNATIEQMAIYCGRNGGVKCLFTSLFRPPASRN